MNTLAKINELYLKGIDQRDIIGLLKPKVKKPDYLLTKLLRSRTKYRVRELRLQHEQSLTATELPQVVKPSQRSRFRKYRRHVRELTEQQPLHTLDNYHLRGFNDHHLDHKVSIWHGFKNNIPAEEIAHISNLRFIPYKENMVKGIRCINEAT